MGDREQIIDALECFHLRILNTNLAEKITESEIMSIVNALSLNRELTAEKSILQAENDRMHKAYYEIACEVEDLREENERLRELGTTKEIEKELVRRETKADTVRKMQERLKALLKTDYINGTREHALSVIDQIAKEMLEGTDEQS